MERIKMKKKHWKHKDSDWDTVKNLMNILLFMKEL